MEIWIPRQKKEGDITKKEGDITKMAIIYFVPDFSSPHKKTNLQLSLNKSNENSRVWGWDWSTPLDNQDKEWLHCKGKRNGCTLTTFFLYQVITGLHKEGSQGLWFFSGKTIQSGHLAPLSFWVTSWEFVTSHSSLALKRQWENSAWFDHSRSDCDGEGVWGFHQPMFQFWQTEFFLTVVPK